MDLYRIPDRKFRPEIEGLRAVASLLVAVYHIWLGNVSGGVDVFFVVAGFLITTSLLSRYERNGNIDFSGFILRLVKRLFPAAFTVLFVIGIVSMLWLPEVRWDQTAQELIASALYFENWQLATSSVDYLAQNNEASPFQHFWAMSLQGQFYIIWPLLLFITILLTKYVFKKQVRPAFLITLVIVFTFSFIYSIYLTAVNQPWAYFDTFTRVWEFSIGGMVALLIANIQLNKSFSFLFSWIGLIALVSCGLILQVSTVFPGYAALWPVLSAVLILLAGDTGGKFSANRILSSKPLMKFGSISYSFYLWHWPVLIFYFILSGNEQAGLFDGLLIMLVSAILSYLTTEYVEKPIRNRKSLNVKWKSAAVALAIMAPVLILSLFWTNTIATQTAELESVLEDENYPGALVTAYPELEINYEEPVRPSPLQARSDNADVYEDGCHQAIGNTEVIECIYGETDDPEYRLALVGGSHAAHWLPALQVFAEEENIQILSYTKSGCRFSSEIFDAEDCTDWNTNLMDTLIESRPDIVFTHADVTSLEPTDPSIERLVDIPEGFVDNWETLQTHDIPVFAVRDNPRFREDIPSCVEEHGEDAMECRIAREDVLPADSPWEKLENKPKNVHYADFSDRFCDEDYCMPVVGNVLAYTDSHHISATYARTLAPFVKEELMPVLENIE
jgi:peptidoglycan/LPS O-acetylase OafA/YrhL